MGERLVSAGNEQLLDSEEINLAQDVKDYTRLDSRERTAYDKILSFRLRLVAEQQPSEYQRVHNCQRSEPMSAHTGFSGVRAQPELQLYARLDMQSEKRNEILYQWKTDEHLLKRNTFIGNCYNEFQKEQTGDTLMKTLMANYILEESISTASTMFFYNLSRNGKMPGSAQEIRYINRDENTHLWLFRNIILELKRNPRTLHRR